VSNVPRLARTSRPDATGATNGRDELAHRGNADHDVLQPKLPQRGDFARLPEDLHLGNPNKLLCCDCMRIEAHAQLVGCGSLDHGRSTSNAFSTRHAIAGLRAIAGWRVIRRPFAILSSSKTETTPECR
jgi:hypothetical protein